MTKSAVLQAVTQAFDDAISAPSSQPQLAAVRGFQRVLFDDLAQTLMNTPQAEDLLVHAEHIGKTFSLSGKHLERWIARYPTGVIWPITVIANPEVGRVAAPFRILVMVPIASPGNALRVPRALAARFATTAWPSQSAMSVGARAAIFVGMFSDQKGHWEYGPAALWSFVVGPSEVSSRALPLIPELVTAKAEELGSDGGTAAGVLAKDYISDELGMLIAHLR